MLNNKRKVYGEENNDNGDMIAPPCRVCGCRHRIITRASATPKQVKISSVCRNCGAEAVDDA